MIISFSGRKGSGKTVLRRYCEKFGFKKVSWADRLKEIVAQLYNWDLDSLNDPVLKEAVLDQPVEYNADTAKNLEDIIGAERPLSNYYKLITTRREALQHIGTDVLREYDSEFHVKSLIGRLNPDENYVLDDTRFHNELGALSQQIKCFAIYVIRPYNFDFSNHRSEIDILRNNFDYHILNTENIKELHEKIGRFLEQVNTGKMIELQNELSYYPNRDLFLDRTSEEANHWVEVFSRRATLKKVDNSWLMQVSRSKFFGDVVPEWVCDRPDLIVDDLKLWNLPLKIKNSFCSHG